MVGANLLDASDWQARMYHDTRRREDDLALFVTNKTMVIEHHHLESIFRSSPNGIDRRDAAIDRDHQVGAFGSNSLQTVDGEPVTVLVTIRQHHFDRTRRCHEPKRPLKNRRSSDAIEVVITMDDDPASLLDGSGEPLSSLDRSSQTLRRRNPSVARVEEGHGILDRTSFKHPIGKIRLRGWRAGITPRGRSPLPCRCDAVHELLLFASRRSHARLHDLVRGLDPSGLRPRSPDRTGPGG